MANFSNAPSTQTLQQFNLALAHLLKANNPPARSLLAFIRRTLRQYQLEGRFSEIDIFVIAYLRGVEQLLDSAAKPIRNPKAWMRSTTLNVIRERSREQQRDRSRMVELSENSVQAHVDSANIDENLDAVLQAFNQLSHDERRLIELKYFKGNSWQQVWERLGEADLTLPALRKRGQRVLEKLREEYHLIKPPVDRP